MSRGNDGGPAFPRPASEDTEGGTLADGNTVEDAQVGMSLRDWFAGQALAGILSNALALSADLSHVERAKAAYGAADAMLAERLKERGR